jgi:hypothetical protein
MKFKSGDLVSYRDVNTSRRGELGVVQSVGTSLDHDALVVKVLWLKGDESSLHYLHDVKKIEGQSEV